VRGWQKRPREPEPSAAGAINWGKPPPAAEPRIDFHEGIIQGAATGKCNPGGGTKDVQTTKRPDRRNDRAQQLKD